MVKSRYRDIVSSKGEILTNYIKAKINPGFSSGVYFIIIAKVFNGFQGNNTIRPSERSFSSRPIDSPGD